MALWYHKGSGYQHVSFARKELGADVFLYAPGPSLREVNDQDIHRPGVLNVAINTAYPHVRPEIWIGMDYPECYDSGLWGEPFIKICRGGYQNKAFVKGKPVREFWNVYFADTQTPGKEEDLFTLRGDNVKFVWHKNTLAIAVHISIWLGAKRIHFVGTDLGGDDGAKDYYDDRVLAEQLRARNKRLYAEQVEYLRRLTQMAPKYGVEFISCTRNTPLNKFMSFVRLETALQDASQRVPSTGGEILDTSEATRRRVFGRGALDWNEKAWIEKGVVVGCDRNCEWLLSWWWENYRKHNDYPVLFVDFGMSPERSQWCARMGFLAKLPDTELTGWHNKPFALLRTVFQKSVWMDLDCEVRRNIGPLFEYGSRESGLAVSKDPHNTFMSFADPVQSGVISFRHGSPAVREWAELTLTDGGACRGDQETLNALRQKREIEIVPHSYNWLRLDGDTNPEAITFHYTGPVGKETIRQKMNGTFQREQFFKSLARIHRWKMGLAIGIGDGKTSFHLLRQFPELRMVGVDLWERPPENQGPQPAATHRWVSPWRPGGDMESVVRESQQYKDRFALKMANPHEFVPTLPDGEFDFVLMDSGHSGDALETDIRISIPKLKPNGILLGHDRPGSGTRGTVESLLPNTMFGPDNVWLIRADLISEERRESIQPSASGELNPTPQS